MGVRKWGSGNGGQCANLDKIFGGPRSLTEGNGGQCANLDKIFEEMGVSVQILTKSFGVPAVSQSG